MSWRADLQASGAWPPRQIRALPLWQPWATLVAIGAKRIETRAYPPTRFGLVAGQRIAIHACKTRDGVDIVRSWPFSDFDLDPEKLPYGAVIAVVTLKDWEMIGAEFREQLTHQERLFGDYRDRRWAWHVENVTPLATPVPYVGSQGTFDISLNLLGLEAIAA